MQPRYTQAWRSNTDIQLNYDQNTEAKNKKENQLARDQLFFFLQLMYY